MASLFADATFWVGLGLLVFLGVVAYMGAFKAFAAMLDARAAAIKAELEEARTLREQAQAMFSQYQRRQREAEKEADDIVAQARLEAERLAAETRAQLDQLIERRTKQAEDKIAQAEAQAAADVRAAATAAAVTAAERLLKDRIDEPRAEALADAAITELRMKLH